MLKIARLIRALVYYFLICNTCCLRILYYLNLFNEHFNLYGKATTSRENETVLKTRYNSDNDIFDNSEI